MKLGILDYSMLKHVATSSVKKHQDLNSMEGHLKCITQRMSEVIYSLKTLEKIDFFVFALDSKPYWRTDYMNKWYKENTEFLMYEEELYWKAYGCVYKWEDEKLTKVTKKLAAPILEANVPPWEEPDGEAIYPKYKGSRSPIDYSWLDCEPKDYHNLIAKLPYIYANLLGGRAVAVEGAEADDIAGILCENAHGKGLEVCLISGDSDWAQLAGYYPKVEYFNPYRGIRHTHAESEELTQKLLAKIVGGDSGDGIRGTASLTKYGPLGETAAAKLVEAQAWGEVDAKYLALNKKLIRLHPDSIPLELRDAVLESMRQEPKAMDGVSWEALMLTPSRQTELDLDNKAAELWVTARDVKAVNL